MRSADDDSVQKACLFPPEEPPYIEAFEYHLL